MGRKGFTLIELLAVIVILAVIALIAVPLILSLVNKSRLKAAEESALFYVDTIENMLMINNIENTDGKTYKVKGKTVVDENNEVILNLEIKGDTPYNGVNNEIKINNGFVETANLRFNAYYVHYEMNMETKEFKTCTSQKGFLDKCDGAGSVIPSVPDEPKVESGATIEMAKDKTYLAEVYLDPTDINKTCTKEEALANVNEFGTPTGIKTGCMKWYVYKDDGVNYTMLLDHNTTATFKTDKTGREATNNWLPELEGQLKKDIESWSEDIQKETRLISGNEVAELTGANQEQGLGWSIEKSPEFSYDVEPASSNGVYFQTGWYKFNGPMTTYPINRKSSNAQAPGSSQFAWLYDYLYQSAERGANVSDDGGYPSVTWGYWTSHGGFWFSNDPTAIYSWAVHRDGCITLGKVINDVFGIRPVITIPKAMFS